MKQIAEASKNLFYTISQAITPSKYKNSPYLFHGITVFVIMICIKFLAWLGYQFYIFISAAFIIAGIFQMMNASEKKARIKKETIAKQYQNTDPHIYHDNTHGSEPENSDYTVISEPNDHPVWFVFDYDKIRDEDSHGLVVSTAGTEEEAKEFLQKHGHRYGTDSYITDTPTHAAEYTENNIIHEKEI